MPLDDARPALTIEYRALADLIPYARNARTHSDAQVALIAASIREFGFTNPVLIDEEAGLIAGHGRVLAARKLGWKHVPTITLAGLSEAQKRALVLADNKIATKSGWDSDLLRVELQDLHTAGYTLDVIGFDAAELTTILGLDTDTATLPDEATDDTRHLLMVEFDNEMALEEAFREAQERGWKAKVMG